MPLFEYRARDKTGKVVIGTVEATGKKTAVETLRKHDLVIISIELKRKIEIIPARVSRKDLVVMSRQLATMLEAGLPIVIALKTLVRQTENPKLKDVLTDVAASVEGGTKLSLALAAYPKAFSNYFVSLVKTGETTGQLDKVLLVLADQQEKDYTLISEIRGALMYPIFIVVGLFVVGLLMIVMVIPQLTAILEEAGQELPIATRMLIGTSNFLTSYWWLVLIVILGIILAVRSYVQTEEGRKWWDGLKLRLPLVGDLFRKIYVARFAGSLSGLIIGGTPIVEALKIAGDVTGSEIYKEVFYETSDAVRGGKPITSVIEKREEVPPMVANMMAVGEKTGKLGEILLVVNNFYTKEVDTSLKGLVRLIEPAVMIIMGIAVGIMVAAIIMPMYNLAGAM